MFFNSKDIIMKNTLIFLLSFIVLPFMVGAQLSIADVEALQVEENERAMSVGKNNSLSIAVPNAEAKSLQKSWTKLMKDYKGGKTKRNRKTKEIFSDDLEITGVGGANTVDVYATVSGNTLTAWFDLGGAYVNSIDHPDKYSSAESILLNFAKENIAGMVEAEVEAEEDKLKKQEKNYEKLVKQKSKLERDIESYKKKIEEAEADIEANIVDQEKTTEAIEAQKEAVEEVKARLSEIKKQ